MGRNKNKRKNVERKEEAAAPQDERLRGLYERLMQSNSFIKSMVDLIPPNVYFGEDDTKKMTSLKHSKVDAKLKGKSEKMSAKAKQKFARFDPDIRKPTTEILEEINNVSSEEEDEEEGEEMEEEFEEAVEETPEIEDKSAKKAKNKRKNKKMTNGTEENGVQSKKAKAEDTTQEDEETTEGKKKKKKSKNKIDANGTDENGPSSESPKKVNSEDLKQRLNEKLDELKGNRRTDEKYLAKIRQKRKDSKTRRKNFILKQKKKGKGKDQKDKDAETAKFADRFDKKTKKTKESSSSPNETTEGGDMQFSAIKTTDRKRRGQFSGKNYEQILKKLEKRDQRISKIGEKNQGKAERVKENLAWKTAMDRAEGVKVRDDVDKLKKVIKKKQDQKKKSKKQWAERLERQEQDKQKRQKKRQDNIQKRKESKQGKRVDKAKKKGRFIQKF